MRMAPSVFLGYFIYFFHLVDVDFYFASARVYQVLIGNCRVSSLSLSSRGSIPTASTRTTSLGRHLNTWWHLFRPHPNITTASPGNLSFFGA